MRHTWMQSQGNKYHAQKVEINGRKFDSKFEAKIYRLLAHYLGEDRVIVHPKIELLDKTSLYAKGKGWAIDFNVNTRFDSLYVEAKGRITLELYWQLNCLELFRPNIFNQFVMVFENEMTYKHSLVSKLADRKVQFDRFTFPQVMSHPQFHAILSGG